MKRSRPFKGHVVNGRPVTVEEGIKAGIIPDPKRDPNYPADGFVNNEKFIEWATDIFNTPNARRPSKLLVYSVETKQLLIDKGVPEECIDVIKPLPKNGNCKIR